MTYHLKIDAVIKDPPFESTPERWAINIVMTQPLTAFIDQGTYLASSLMNRLREREPGLLALDPGHLAWVPPAKQRNEILSWMEFAGRTDRPIVLATGQPMIISTLRRDQVFMVESIDGRVVATPIDQDPRMMTANEIHRRLLGCSDAMNPVFKKVKRYEFLAGISDRTDEEEARMQAIATELRELGIDRIVEPVE